ncbi:2-dehydropantoate 2-reductase [Rhodobium orientis]|nr:2-dehydropantoate 2-reductase [Rhodobium orientis]MBB4301062.1 2-dehydropantoate 2-reductase [Rhodobium orientis]
MKICVYGAGAIGGHLAVRLAEAGHDVSVVARGPHLAAIREAGLSLQSDGKTVTVHPQATDDPSSLPTQDIVLVTVKTPALMGIADGIAALCGPETAVAFCVNGLPWWYLASLDVPQDAWSPAIAAMIGALTEKVGISRTIGGIAFSANHVEAPGLIMNSSPTANRFVFGEADERVRPLCAALVEALSSDTLDAVHSETFEREIWKKLSLNCVTGGIGALTGMTSRNLLIFPPLADLTRDAWLEVGAVAAAFGMTDILAPLKETVARVGNHKSSMLQDFELRRKPEIETLLGGVSDLGRLKGVPVPTIDTLLALTRARAETLGIAPFPNPAQS